MNSWLRSTKLPLVSKDGAFEESVARILSEKRFMVETTDEAYRVVALTAAVTIDSYNYWIKNYNFWNVDAAQINP